jgi:hypothetical protein
MFNLQAVSADLPSFVFLNFSENLSVFMASKYFSQAFSYSPCFTRRFASSFNLFARSKSVCLPEVLGSAEGYYFSG